MTITLHYRYFNSIKVRLKPKIGGARKDLYADFNSIKVRLKPETGTAQESGRTFQFHKGTIKTVRTDISFLPAGISIP